MNVTSPLSHHILHQILVSCSCQYFSFPRFSPMHSSRMFPITGFFLKCPIHSFLPQWPNIFILTKQCSINLRYSVNSLDNKTIHGKGHSNMFDISENSTMGKTLIFFFT